jgi:hypothetical protein
VLGFAKGLDAGRLAAAEGRAAFFVGAAWAAVVATASAAVARRIVRIMDIPVLEGLRASPTRWLLTQA